MRARTSAGFVRRQSISLARGWAAATRMVLVEDGGSAAKVGVMKARRLSQMMRWPVASAGFEENEHQGRKPLRSFFVSVFMGLKGCQAEGASTLRGFWCVRRANPRIGFLRRRPSATLTGQKRGVANAR